MTKNFIKTFIYLSTVILGQLVSFLLLPFITKYLKPEVYGEYALALTIFSLINVLGSSWVRNVAFRLYFDEKKIKQTKNLFINVTFVQFFIVVIITLIAIPVLQLSVFKFDNKAILFAAAVSIVVGDIYAWSINLLRAENLTYKFAFCQFVYSVIRFFVTVIGLIVGLRSPEFLFWCTTVATLITSCIAIIFLWRNFEGKVYLSKNIFNRVLSLGVASIPLSIGFWIMELSDRMILKYYSNLSEVGVYSVGYSLGDRLIGGLVAGVFMMAWPDILESWNDFGEVGAKNAITSSLKIFILLTVGPLIFVCVFNNEIVTMLTSSEYDKAAQVVPVIAISAWMLGLISYINRPIELQKNYMLMSLITMLAALSNLVLNFIFIPSQGAYGAAISTLLSCIISFIVFLFFTKRSFIVFPFFDLFLISVLSLVCFIVQFICIDEKNYIMKMLMFVVIYSVGILLKYFIENKQVGIKT